MKARNEKSGQRDKKNRRSAELKPSGPASSQRPASVPPASAHPAYPASGQHSGQHSAYRSAYRPCTYVRAATPTQVMYRVADGTQSASVYFFLLLVFFGAYFVINLFLAILKIKFGRQIFLQIHLKFHYHLT